MIMEENRQGAVFKKNVVYNAVGQVFYAGCQWLLTVLVLRLSGLEDSGLLTLCISVTNTFFPFAIMGLRTLQVSDTEGTHSDSTYVTMSFAASVLSWVLCTVYVGLVGYNMRQCICVSLFMGFKVSEAAVDCFHGIDQKYWRFDLIAVSLLLRGAAGVLAFVGGLTLGHSLPVAIVCMGAASYGVILLFDIPQSRKLHGVRFFWDWQEVRDVFGAGKYVTLSSVLSSAIILIPREALLQYYGTDALGLYGTLSAPTALISMVASFLFTPLISVLAHHFRMHNKNGIYKTILKVTIFIFALGIAAESAVFVCGKWAVNLLFGAEVAAYTNLLYPLILCALCIALTAFFSLALVVVRSLKILLFSGGVGFLAAQVASKFFVPLWGMNGVNATLVISELCILAVQITGLLIALHAKE